MAEIQRREGEYLQNHWMAFVLNPADLQQNLDIDALHLRLAQYRIIVKMVDANLK